MTSSKLLTYAFFGEQVAIMALFSNLPVWSRVLLFLAGHSISSATLAVLLTAAMPSRFEVQRVNTLALYFSFAFFIPVFGGLGIVVALIYFRYFQRFSVRTEFSSMQTPYYMNEAGGLAPGMGEGGAWSRLRTGTLPRTMRMKALMAVGAGGGNNASRLLQLATGDNDDEIRLLAFNLYQQRENKIGKTIAESLKSLRETDQPAERGALYRKLAFSYWEMVFNELAKNELAHFFVEQSLSYARQALELIRNDTSVLVLMGRLYLWQGDTRSSEEAINAALESGAHRNRVIPYLAELAYRRRDFDALKSLFANDPLLRHKPGIGPVAQFWLE